MLTRFDPFAELDRFQSDVARSLESSGRRAFAPAVDIFEDKDAIHVRAELAGVKSEDVKIDVENNILTLRGERKLEHADRKDAYHRVERWHGSFTRQFMLPRTVDSENIDAQLKDGVLTVKLPKKNEVRQRSIAVKAS
jgi:HSP20 family protein